MIAVLTAQNTTWADVAFAAIMAAAIVAIALIDRWGSRR